MYLIHSSQTVKKLRVRRTSIRMG